MSRIKSLYVKVRIDQLSSDVKNGLPYYMPFEPERLTTYRDLILKVPITTATDDNLNIFHCFSEKIRLYFL